MRAGLRTESWPRKAPKTDYMAALAPELPKGVPFTRALGALAVTPLVGSVILAITFLPRVGSAFSIMVLYIAPFAYATAAAFVLPILMVWPPSRRPSYVLAAVWGALAACGAWFVLASQQAGGFEMSMPRPVAIGLIWSGAMPGVVSGMFYAWLVRRGDGE